MTTLSNKYKNLKVAENAGLKVPKTLLLRDNNGTAITDFIKHCNANSLYIIRSIQTCEDGDGLSYAGYFWSSPAITADKIEENIVLATQKNQVIMAQLSSTEKPQLMLQEFIEHSIGGILFSPWSFFSEYSYIEYSTDSVQKAVEGQIESAILNHDDSFSSPLPLPKTLYFLVKPLQDACRQLQSLFHFPFDCEWVCCEQSQQVIILQVRPQTSLVGPILGAVKKTDQINLSRGNWQYTALSESLGRLSPLSFSLLQALYDETKPAFQSLGLVAKHSDFMQRLPDGSVLSDPKIESEFYTSTKMGGFWRGFRAPQWKQKCNDCLKNIKLESSFSYPHLSQLFQFWMVANFLSKGKGRDQQPLTHAYELTWQQSLVQPCINTDKKTWNQLNPLLHDLFFYELEKLKKQLSREPEKAFTSWLEYQKQTSNRVKTLKQQYNDAHLALYDYSMIGSKSNAKTMLSIGVRKEVTGTLFFIKKPSQFQQHIPDNSILIVPYFSNSWVHNIKRLSAIIVEQGGQLSHSAIVARECGVPYFIADNRLFDNFKHCDNVSLSILGNLTKNDE